MVAVSERVMATYDAETLDQLGSVPAGTGPTHVAAAGRRAFVVDTTGDAVLELDIGADPRLVSTTPAPGAPYGIAIDPRRNRLWVTLTARNEAVAYAITSSGLRPLERYPTVRQPNTIAVDARSGDPLVAGRSAGGPLQRIRSRIPRATSGR